MVETLSHILYIHDPETTQSEESLVDPVAAVQAVQPNATIEHFTTNEPANRASSFTASWWARLSRSIAASDLIIVRYELAGRSRPRAVALFSAVGQVAAQLDTEEKPVIAVVPQREVDMREKHPDTRMGSANLVRIADSDSYGQALLVRHIRHVLFGD